MIQRSDGVGSDSTVDLPLKIMDGSTRKTQPTALPARISSHSGLHQGMDKSCLLVEPESFLDF